MQEKTEIAKTGFKASQTIALFVLEDEEFTGPVLVAEEDEGQYIFGYELSSTAMKRIATSKIPSSLSEWKEVSDVIKKHKKLRPKQREEILNIIICEFIRKIKNIHMS